MLADNIFEHTIRSHVERYRNQEKGARVLLKTVDNPERFGIAELSGNRVISIEEKSKHPKSNYAVVGAYFHDSTVFDIIRHISPSGRREYEITSVNNEYIRRRQLEHGIVRGNWIDAGTFEALLEARKIFRRSNNCSQEGTLP